MTVQGCDDNIRKLNEELVTIRVGKIDGDFHFSNFVTEHAVEGYSSKTPQAYVKKFYDEKISVKNIEDTEDKCRESIEEILEV